jgi:hypothetical protein
VLGGAIALVAIFYLYATFHIAKMWQIFVLVAVAVYADIDDEYELPGMSGMSNLDFKVEHSYNGREWETRGNLHVSSTLSVRKNSGELYLKTTKFEKDKLEKSGYYYLRVTSGENTVAQTFIPTCQLIASDLQERITVFIDPDGTILSLNYNGAKLACAQTTTAIKPKT